MEIVKDESLKEDFWKNQKKVRNTLRDKKFYEDIISSYNNFDNELKDLLDIHKLGLEEKNEEILNDCSLKIEDLIKKLKKKEINCFLSGENDKLDIYL